MNALVKEVLNCQLFSVLCSSTNQVYVHLHTHGIPVHRLQAVVLFLYVTMSYFLPHAVAALSQLETLTSDMARVATMELVDFWQFMEILIAQVFKKFNKQFSQKVCLFVLVDAHLRLLCVMKVVMCTSGVAMLDAPRNA